MSSMSETLETVGTGRAKTLNENASTMPLIDTVAVWRTATNCEVSMISFNFTLERDLHFEIGGRRSTGKLRVGKIEKTDRADPGGFWVCYWSLDEIHPSEGKIYGVDALDSFLNCIQFLQMLVARHKAAGYRVWWNVEGDDAGLVPPSTNEQAGIES
jgi:hypothetical protein